MRDNYDKKVIDRINNYIRLNGLSVPKIAREAGLEYNFLYKTLNMRSTISLSTYIRLCKAFDEDFTYFLT